MGALEFDYSPLIGIVLMAIAIHMARTVIRDIRMGSSFINTSLGSLLTVAPAWVGLDYLTWKAELNPDGVTISRKGLPADIDLPFLQPAHSIPWSETTSVNFSSGYGSGKGRTPPSLRIHGSGGAIDFPIDSIGREAAVQVARLLAICSPASSLKSSEEDMVSAAGTVGPTFGLDWGLRVSAGASQGLGACEAPAR